MDIVIFDEEMLSSHLKLWPLVSKEEVLKFFSIGEKLTCGQKDITGTMMLCYNSRQNCIWIPVEMVDNDLDPLQLVYKG